MTCAFCDQPSAKFFPVHRDGHEVGPLVDICHRCTCIVPMVAIWFKLAQPSSHPSAFKPVHSILGLPTQPEVRATR